MLRLATDPDNEYVPFAMTNRDLTNNKLSYQDNGILGAKNLLPNNAVTRENGGITYTVNSDGSVKANGTVPSGGVSYLVIASGTTGGAENNSLSANGTTLFPAGMTVKTSEKRLAVRYTDDSYGTVNANTVFTFPKNVGLVYITYSAGASPSNEIHYPMFRLESDPDDTYVPYAMTNREITSNIGGLKVKWFKLTSVKKLSDNTWASSLVKDNEYYFPHGISGLDETRAAFAFGYGYYSLVNNINNTNVIFKAGRATNDLTNYPMTGVLLYY